MSADRPPAQDHRPAPERRSATVATGRSGRVGDGPGRRGLRPAGYNPALDGVRALAVLCVLVFHMDALPGGYLGVDVFFVLSGFLITGGLLAERDRTGGMSLTRFYLRRAYRLLPAFWLLVAVATGWVVVLGMGTAGERREFLDSLASSTLYLNNYFQVVKQSTGAGWLGHTWSLSLEEQFYLLWPLVLIVLCRRPRIVDRLPVVLLGGAVAVALWRNVLVAFGAQGTRTYFALDTRADALLVGCALAAWLRAARRAADGRGGVAEASRRRVGLESMIGALPVIGTLALAILAVEVVRAPSGWGPPTILTRGGYTLIALVVAALILALEQGATTSWLFRVLAAAPLAWLGRISYGFYLWHFPVVAHWGPDLTDTLGRWPAILAVGVISVALAAASYYLLEQPIQRARAARSKARSGQPAPAPELVERDALAPVGALR
ncbi:acyltransferase family protein [Frankia sp. AgKG'84/4]|uniref:acyltransferase family protein n=1 Tax=Frankia sp. AgKG'84/4 TaxID=573490 RepID=UPI00200E2F2B|nr:acyltransferase [Frankia sp. AgKG'84/4]MCL9796570.1 acyltransferase [Frankia sp. AgKG'84/4]